MFMKVVCGAFVVAGLAAYTIDAQWASILGTALIGVGLWTFMNEEEEEEAREHPDSIDPADRVRSLNQQENSEKTD